MCVGAGIIVAVILPEVYRSSFGISACMYVLYATVSFVYTVHVSYLFWFSVQFRLDRVQCHCVPELPEFQEEIDFGFGVVPCFVCYGLDVVVICNFSFEYCVVEGVLPVSRV